MMYHIGLDASVGAKYVLLPGDPDRVEKIAAYLDNPRFLAKSREYTSWLGYIGDEPVLVMSTGMGGPSTAIAVEELVQVGVHTAIRVGSTGGINLAVKGGDIVIANGAIRTEGTSKEYLPIEYPAVADFEVTHALLTAAKQSEADYHLGVVQSKDSFYGQHDPERMPVAAQLLENWEAWKKAGVLASEMECAALYTTATVCNMRAGAVLHVLWNQERKAEGLDDTDVFDMENTIKTAIKAIQILIETDKEK